MPGKTSRRATSSTDKDAASMRPQRNAGENLRIRSRLLSRLVYVLASMRPQRNAGENTVSFEGDRE